MHSHTHKSFSWTVQMTYFQPPTLHPVLLAIVSLYKDTVIWLVVHFETSESLTDDTNYCRDLRGGIFQKATTKACVKCLNMCDDYVEN